MPDIITLGDINIDIVASVPSYPTHGGDTVAEDLRLCLGGSAANTAVALARFGVEAGFIGRVGSDALAAQAVSELADAGVDTRLVQSDPAVPTGVVFVAVARDGERTMFSARGANSHTDGQLITKDYFAGARWFHLSCYALLAEGQRSAALRALELASQAGCRISLDVGPEPALHARHHIRSLLPRVDILFSSEAELLLLAADDRAGHAVAQLLEYGVGTVVTKLGANGSEVALENRRVRLPAFKIVPLDTTGAGDCFDAGFILGRLAGLGWDAATVLGNAIGASSTQWRGAGAVNVTPTALRELIEKHRDGPEWLESQNALRVVLDWLTSHKT